MLQFGSKMNLEIAFEDLMEDEELFVGIILLHSVKSVSKPISKYVFKKSWVTFRPKLNLH